MEPSVLLAFHKWEDKRTYGELTHCRKLDELLLNLKVISFGKWGPALILSLRYDP